MSEPMPWTGELHVHPWDALIAEVRRSAYRAAWIDDRIDTEIDRERRLIEDLGDGFEKAEEYERAVNKRSAELREWIEQSRKERAHMATVSASAVRAGLSERYIESVQTEARMIAGVLTQALDAAELSSEQRERANAALRVALAEVGRELRARHGAASGVAVRPEIGR